MAKIKFDVEVEIPNRLDGLSLGDVLRFRDFNDLEREHAVGKVRCGWSKGMTSTFKNSSIKFVVDEIALGKIKSNNNTVFNSNGFSLSLDMLEFDKFSPSNRKNLVNDIQVHVTYVMPVSTLPVDIDVNKVVREDNHIVLVREDEGYTYNYFIPYANILGMSVVEKNQ